VPFDGNAATVVASEKGLPPLTTSSSKGPRAEPAEQRALDEVDGGFRSRWVKVSPASTPACSAEDAGATARTTDAAARVAPTPA
jgi:hypothetical protein